MNTKSNPNCRRRDGPTYLDGKDSGSECAHRRKVFMRLQSVDVLGGLKNDRWVSWTAGRAPKRLSALWGPSPRIVCDF
jgi:hypothetical protein